MRIIARMAARSGAASAGDAMKANGETGGDDGGFCSARSREKGRQALATAASVSVGDRCLQNAPRGLLRRLRGAGRPLAFHRPPTAIDGIAIPPLRSVLCIEFPPHMSLGV